MSVRVALAAAIALMGVVSVSQIVRAETAEEREACTRDAFKHCNEFISMFNSDGVYHCLVKHRYRLNDVCRRAITASLKTSTKR